jgi:hypothetical protein
MLCRVVWQKLTDVLEFLIASFFKASETSVLLPGYAAQHPRKVNFTDLFTFVYLTTPLVV